MINATSNYALLIARVLQTPPLHLPTPSSQPDSVTAANSVLYGWVNEPGLAFATIISGSNSQISPYHKLSADCDPLASLQQRI